MRRVLTTAFVAIGSTACALALTLAPPLPVDALPALADDRAIDGDWHQSPLAARHGGAAHDGADTGPLTSSRPPGARQT